METARSGPAAFTPATSPRVIRDLMLNFRWISGLGRGGDESGGIGGSVIKGHSGFDIGHIVRLENLHGFDTRHPLQSGLHDGTAQNALRMMDIEDHAYLAGLRRERREREQGDGCKDGSSLYENILSSAKSRANCALAESLVLREWAHSSSRG